MNTFYSIPNWRKYQHYKDRTPVWVKLHVESLHDEKLRRLSLEARLMWHEMLKLAATFQNAVPSAPEVLGNLAGIPPETCREACGELVKARLLREKKTRRSASKLASAEKEKEEDKEKNARAKPSASEEHQKPMLSVVQKPWEPPTPDDIQRVRDLIPPSLRKQA